MVAEMKKKIGNNLVIESIKKNPGHIVLKRLSQKDINRWTRKHRQNRNQNFQPMLLRNRKKVIRNFNKS